MSDIERAISSGLVSTDGNIPWMGKAILILVLGFTALVSSCTVLTSFDDEAVAIAEKDLRLAQTEADKVAHTERMALEQKRLDMLKRLIDENGWGPVAARCAVKGWKDDEERQTCQTAEANVKAK